MTAAQTRSVARGPVAKGNVAGGARPKIAGGDIRERRRFIAVIALTVLLLVFVAVFGAQNSPLAGRLPAAAGWWLQFALATPVVFWGGAPAFSGAARAVVKLKPDQSALIALALLLAYGYSCLALVAPERLPDGFLTDGGGAPLLFAHSAAIAAFDLVRRALEAHARTIATDEAYWRAPPPPFARRINRNKSEDRIPADQVRVGDYLRVRPDEFVPADGVVATGEGVVDEQALRGAPAKIEARKGAMLLAGSRNGAAALIMRVRRVGDDALLGRIAAITRHAQRSRAALGEKLDRPIAVFIPLTIVLAALVFAAWSWLGPAPAAALGLVNAICVLVVACPDALRYAAPGPVMVAIGRAARAGLVFRDARSLEALANASVVVVNKSGVLTEGKLRLMVVEAASGFTETEVLAAAAAAETNSDHPIARAIVEGARARGVAIPKSVKHRALAGEGVFAVAAGGRKVAVGNLKMISRFGENALPPRGAGDRHRLKGRTVVFVSINGARAGLLGVADQIKPRVRDTIAALRADGLKVMMLTGDNRKTAAAIADDLGIDDIRAEVSGGDKARIIGELQKNGANVAMVSDAVSDGFGIKNSDAPALARANVGVALMTGAELSLPKTGLAVLCGDLSGLVRARKLSLATMRIIRQNVRVALGFTVLGVTLAAGALYPAGFLLSPIAAAAAMSLVSAAPLANALRLRRVKI